MECLCNRIVETYGRAVHMGSKSRSTVELADSRGVARDRSPRRNARYYAAVICHA